jgi:hypothetical protein
MIEGQRSFNNISRVAVGWDEGEVVDFSDKLRWGSCLSFARV